eukprot:gene15714-18669_t
MDPACPYYAIAIATSVYWKTALTTSLRMLGLAAALTVACNANADSFVSSASSAGSQSSGSISDSLKGSSNSSSRDNKVANGPYRIIDVAAVPGRDGMTRLTMQADATATPLVLDLPQAALDKQLLAQGDMVYAQNRAYGIEFSRNDTRAAFFLPLIPRLPPRRLARCLAACAALALAGAAHAGASLASARFCDRAQELTATEQDRLLRFAAVVREELAASEGSVALISRSGLDLARFGIRYSHAALAWRHDDGAWSARQLYYACDEGRPRIFDQGTAGFAMGTENPALGYIALVKLPAETTPPLRRALLDPVRVQQLLAGRYSANAYAFNLKYQNCNQWVVEMLAAAWGELAEGSDLRARAQDWLRTAPYAPAPVDVGARWLMLGSIFVPLVHMDDHPPG